jgi:cardiolipin synthase (CMP-forming)
MINKNEIFTISNLLSIVRLLLAVPIWYLFNSIGQPGIRTSIIIICFVALVTDVLDGYLARKLNQITEFGKIIDPLADKVVVAALVIQLYLIGEIDSTLFFFVIGRDLLILIFSLMLANKLKKVLPSNYVGKATVLFIGINILLCLVQVSRINIYYQITYYGSIILIVLSIIIYTFRGIKSLRTKNEPI